MSNNARALMALCVVAFLAACAKKEETVVVEEVTTEPTYTGKYK
jgi:hypothetical protein